MHVYHHSYRGHPYYGRHYRDNWWYRRPSINIHNTTYITNTNRTTNVHVARTVDYDRGDRWHPRSDRREYIVGEGYSNRTRGRTSDSVATTRKRTGGSVATRSTRQPPAVRSRQPDAITFRDRTLNEDRRESRQGRRTDQTSRPATVRAGSTRTKSGSVSERRYVTPKTEARVPTSRRTESRRQEPVRSVREEPARTSRQSRVVRPEPARTVRPEPSRTARPEPSRRETTRRESSRPARQERAAPQRESRPSRSEPSRRESRDRSSRQKRK